MDEDNQTTDSAEDADLMHDLPDDQLEDVQQDLAGEGDDEDDLADNDIDDETEPAA